MPLPAFKLSESGSPLRQDPNIKAALHPANEPRRSPDFDCQLLSRANIADPRVRMLRGWRRTPVRLEAEIATDAKRYAARVVDIARSGAGLLADHDLRPGDLLTIELQSRRLAASVRWTGGKRVGVEFAEPLAADDALLKLCVSAGIVDTTGLGASSPDSANSSANSKHIEVLPEPGFRAVLRSIYEQHSSAWQQTARTLFGWLASMRGDRNRGRQHELVERACRKQGFSWLVDEDGV